MTLRSCFAAMMGISLMFTGCGRAQVPENADLDVEIGRAPGPRASTRPKGKPVERAGGGGPRKVVEPSTTLPERGQQVEPNERQPEPPSAGAGPASDSGQGQSGSETTQRPPSPAGSGPDHRTPQPARQQSAPVFPGRERGKQPETPAAAAAEGRRLVQRAAAAARGGDHQAACRLAVSACSAVAGHAESDPECRRVAAEAERVIEQCGGRAKGANVPTRFE